MAVLKEVEVRWAQVLTPDTRFEPVWTIEAILTEDHKDQLIAESKSVDPKGKGVKIKEDDNGNPIFRFRRKVNKADGSGENQPPLVCGPGGKDDKWDKLIGNGSICNIQYRAVPYENKFGKGVILDLKGVQVVHHVPYGAQDGDEFEAVDTPSKPRTPAPASDSNEYDDDDFAN